MDKIERKSYSHCDPYNRGLENGFEKKLMEFISLKSRRMKRLKKEYLKEMEDYKKKAHKIRLSERKKGFKEMLEKKFVLLAPRMIMKSKILAVFIVRGKLGYILEYDGKG
jgi:hypothetical protein